MAITISDIENLPVVEMTRQDALDVLHRLTDAALRTSIVTWADHMSRTGNTCFRFSRDQFTTTITSDGGRFILPFRVNDDCPAVVKIVTP